MATDKDTADRLAELLASTESRFADLFKIADGDDVEASDTAHDEIAESAYGANLVRHVHIVLAGGGPSLYLDVELDSDGDVDDVTAVSSWWSAPTRTEIQRDSALWRYAESETSHYGPIEER